MTKWIGIAGQSNGQLMWHNGSLGSRISRVAVASAALNVNSGPYPFAWGPGDPYSFRSRLAAELRTARTIEQPSVLWFQGERDATAASNHYGADLLELVTSMDVLFGRSDVLWGIVRLHAGFVNDTGGGDPVTGTPLVRAGQASAVAAMPTRLALLDVDDLPLRSDAHYAGSDYLTIWGRHKAAMATLSGDSTWTA